MVFQSFILLIFFTSAIQISKENICFAIVLIKVPVYLERNPIFAFILKKTPFILKKIPFLHLSWISYQFSFYFFSFFFSCLLGRLGYLSGGGSLFAPSKWVYSLLNRCFGRLPSNEWSELSLWLFWRCEYLNPKNLNTKVTIHINYVPLGSFQVTSTLQI